MHAYAVQINLYITADGLLDFYYLGKYLTQY